VKRIVTITAMLVMLGLSVPGHSRASQSNVTTNAINFGGYDPLSLQPTATSSTISITGQAPDRFLQPVTLRLSPRNSETPAQRFPAGVDGGTLRYNLYLAAGMAQVLADGSAGLVTPSQQLSRPTPWTLNLCGRIPPLQNIPASLYSNANALTVTIPW